MDHGEGAIQGADASHVEDRMFFFWSSSSDKEHIATQDDVEVIGPGRCSGQPRWLASFFQAPFACELLDDILDDVRSGASSLEQPYKLFDMWVSLM